MDFTTGLFSKIMQDRSRVSGGREISGQSFESWRLRAASSCSSSAVMDAAAPPDSLGSLRFKV